VKAAGAGLSRRGEGSEVERAREKACAPRHVTRSALHTGRLPDVEPGPWHPSASPRWQQHRRPPCPSGLEAALFGLASPLAHDGTLPASELRARPRGAAARFAVAPPRMPARWQAAGCLACRGGTSPVSTCSLRVALCRRAARHRLMRRAPLRSLALLPRPARRPPPRAPRRRGTRSSSPRSAFSSPGDAAERCLLWQHRSVRLSAAARMRVISCRGAARSAPLGQSA
jgi:hypothetical protein